MTLSPGANPHPEPAVGLLERTVATGLFTDRAHADRLGGEWDSPAASGCKETRALRGYSVLDGSEPKRLLAAANQVLRAAGQPDLHLIELARAGRDAARTDRQSAEAPATRKVCQP